MIHRLNLTWIMKAAHNKANATKGQYASYKAALAVAMKIAWSVAKGEAVPVEHQDMVHSYAEFRYTWKLVFRTVDTKEVAVAC
jgi:hypothetical protein